MKEYLPALKQCALFAQMDTEEMLHMLNCFGTQVLQVQRGGYLMRQGERADRFGVLIFGRAQIIRGDAQGAHVLIAPVEPTEVFAEAVACAQADALPFSVIASEDCTALMFRQETVMKSCTKGCRSHSQLVSALLQMISKKNLFLNQKLDIVMQRTTREKLTAYLRYCSERANSTRFWIPLDRQGMADFLGVDRSAMSAELSRMRKEGLIDFHKNQFDIHL